MKKRNWILGILAAIVLTVSLAGCSSKNEAASEKGGKNLTIWYYQGSISENVVSNAKKKFKDYNLDFKKMPSDGYPTKIDTALNSGKGPDIAMMFSLISYQKHADKFLNLLDYDVTSVKAKYLDWKWNQCLTADKKQMIGMPTDIGPMVICYREDMFKKAGLPTDPKEVSETFKTWDDYYAAGKQMKAKTGTPMFDNVTRLFRAQYLQMDHTCYDTEGKLLADNGDMKQIWDNTIKFKEAGLLAKVTDKEWSSAVSQNGFAAFPAASWELATLKDSAKNQAGKWRVASLPGGGANYGGSFASILKSTKHPKEATKVLEYLVSPESQLENYKDVDLYPCTPSVYGDQKMTKEDKFFGGQVVNDYLATSAQSIKTTYTDPREDATMAGFNAQILLAQSQNKNSEKAWKEAIKVAKQASEKD